MDGKGAAMEIRIGNRIIGQQQPVYFIADIAANHDGDLERAKMLIDLARAAGADAAKFQNFHAPKIVSDYGFKNLGGQQSHQANWKHSVFEVYQSASVPDDWTPILNEYCDRAGIEYFSSPYDFAATDLLDDYVKAHKIGSGEIDWIETLEYIAMKGKPVLLATGACDIGEVQRAVHAIFKFNSQLVLMQCNTNYTASVENFRHINLNVLKTYAQMFPEVILGLSDHTPGHTTVLGAVALGVRVIEKHFTDDNGREGPDHHFAMNPITWRAMVDATRELEYALGSGDKVVADNEKETVVIQRRCLRAARDIKVGELLTREMIDVLRPATPGAIQPSALQQVLGARVLVDISFGKELTWMDLGK
jgi:N-acetylneuraminate synthase